jgi:hypothetical protein
LSGPEAVPVEAVPVEVVSAEAVRSGAGRESPNLLVMEAQNHADENRRICLSADARQEAGFVDLMTVGRDWDEIYRSWLVRLTPDEAEQWASNILRMAAEARARGARLLTE